MFNFFKKKDEPFHVVACTSGKCIKIEDVKDEVFSQKMMGDGFAIIPDGDTVVSPVNGTIVTVFPTGHAIGIKTKDNIEIILHIGIDTVNLNGEGFKTLVKSNTKVKAGQLLVKIDKELLESKGYDLTTLTIFTSGYNKDIHLSYYGKTVTAGEVLIQ